jgi:acetyltransferase-like isoleucine patch superfamily enzyme
MSPWYVDISGPNIAIGHSFTAINTASQRVQIGVWGRAPGEGQITLGNACLMSPGSRISASDSITLGDGCMLANGALYHRLRLAWLCMTVSIALMKPPPCIWVPMSGWATMPPCLKGVSIGDNSIVAAQAVVTSERAG